MSYLNSINSAFKCGVLLTVPSMRRKGRPILVCHVCGDFSMRLLIVSRSSAGNKRKSAVRISKTHNQNSTNALVLQLVYAYGCWSLRTRLLQPHTHTRASGRVSVYAASTFHGRLHW